MAQSNVLFNRLKQHSYSINQVDNLQIEAFWCRLAILTGLEADLIVPLEAALIRKYQPLWNTTVDGFGNHDPGRGRYQQAISDWDLLHPGRPWATHLTSGLRQREQVIQKVAQYQINKG
jgi:hypothetical protein